MMDIDNIKEYLLTVLENYLNAPLENIDIKDGAELDRIYPNNFETVELNKSDFNVFCLNMIRNILYNLNIDINKKEIDRIKYKMLRKLGYITIDNNIVKATDDIKDFEYEYIISVNGDNYIEVLNEIYNKFKNVDIPFNIISTMSINDRNYYEISILTNNQYRKDTENIIDTLNIDNLVVDPITFGTKYRKGMSFDVLDKKINGSTNGILGIAFINGIKKTVETWLSENPDEIELIEYYNKEENKNVAYRQLIKIIEVRDTDIRLKIYDNIMNQINELGIDYKEALKINEFVRVIRLEPVKITHEELDSILTEAEKISVITEEEIKTDEVTNPYIGIISDELLNTMVLNNSMTLREYLDTNKVLEKTPHDAIVELDEGYSVDGFTFIRERVVPAVIELNHQNVEETIEKYASNYLKKDNKSIIKGLFKK